MTDGRDFEASASTSPAQAAMMLDTFASVGGTHFDVTFTDLDSQKLGFRVNRPLTELQKTMPAEIAARTRDRHNVIVRPRVDIIGSE